MEFVSYMRVKVNIVKLYIMKRLLLSLVIVLSGSSLYAAEVDSVFVNSDTIHEDCTCKGIKLYGKVKIVSHGADLKVKVVDNWPGMR